MKEVATFNLVPYLEKIFPTYHAKAKEFIKLPSGRTWIMVKSGVISPSMANFDGRIVRHFSGPNSLIATDGSKESGYEIRSITESEYLVLPEPDLFHYLLEPQNPEFRILTLAQMAREIRRRNIIIANQLTQPNIGKLALTILELCDVFGSNEINMLNQSFLGQAAGLEREATNRGLRMLANEELIDYHGARLTVVDYFGLETKVLFNLPPSPESCYNQKVYLPGWWNGIHAGLKNP